MLGLATQALRFGSAGARCRHRTGAERLPDGRAGILAGSVLVFWGSERPIGCQAPPFAHSGDNPSRLTTMPGKSNIAPRPQPASKVTRMYLQRLEIIEHPRFAPCVLDFSKGFNAVLGKNGTGKTTLLKLLVKLVNGEWSTLAKVDESCQVELTFADAERALQVQFSARPGRHKLPKKLRDATDKPAQAWSLSASAVSKSGKIAEVTISSDAPSSLVFAGEAIETTARPPRGAFSIELLTAIKSAPVKRGEKSFGISHLGRLILDALLRAGPCLRFDEALGGFKWLCEPERPRMESDMQRDGAWVLWDDDVLQSFADGPPLWAKAVSGSTQASDVRENMWLPVLPFLERLKDLFGMERLDVQPVMQSTNSNGSFTTWTFDGLRFKITYPNGLTVFDRDLSFGQKRLLAFYWYLACIPDGIVIADELVNGFHHDWIKGCLEEIGDRQAILATQSPLLLDYLGFEDAEQVRRSYVLCSIDDSAEGGRKFKLRNPTEEESQRFMEAYDAGYQQVNEILSAMGMW
jgi:energy-coupling factor transporter ATP-binding protein EcfA2